MIRFTDFRLDASTLKDLPDGSIRVTGQLTHPGIFSYRNPDGSERKEYRPADEVLSAKTLETFASLPITVNHPNVGGKRLVTSDTWKQVAVGHLGENVRADGANMVADLYIRDAATVSRVKKGELKYVSCGYGLDYDPTPGTTEDGQRFDGVQRNLRGNHVALLPQGVAPRGGNDCVLRLDSQGDEVTELNYVVDLEALKAQVTVLTAELAKARTDAADVDNLKTQLAAAAAKVAELTALVSPERLDALADERAVIVALGKSEGVETAGKSAVEIKRAVVAKRTPDLASRVDSLDGSALDAVLAVYKAQPHKSMDVLGAGNTDGTRTDAATQTTNKIPTIGELRQKYLSDSQKLWKNTGDASR